MKIQMAISMLQILMISSFIHGQSKFSFSIEHFGGISMRSYGVNPSFNSPSTSISHEKSVELTLIGEMPHYSHDTRIFCSRDFGRRYSIFCGLEFQSFSRTKVYDTSSNILDPRKPSTIYQPSSGFQYYQIFDSDRYAGILAGMSFNVINFRESTLFLRTSISPLFYYNSISRRKAVYDDSEIIERLRTRSDHERTLSPIGRVGLGFQSRLNRCYSVSYGIEATSQLISSFKSASAYRQHWHSLLCYVGIVID